MKRGDVGNWLYSKEFVQARLTTYGVVMGMVLLSTFMPFHYSCGGTRRCLGCGFRTALRDLVRLRLAVAVRDNGLILAIILILPLVIMDLAVMTIRRRRFRLRQEER